MEIKNKLTVAREGKGDNGGKKGKGQVNEPLKTKGPMNKDNGGDLNVGRWDRQSRGEE